MIYGLQYYAGFPSEWLEWHGHNDLYLVSANAVTAWLYGCSAANGTLLGIGERTGNPPIEGMIINYLQLRGNDCHVDTTVITEIAEYFEHELKVQIPGNQPLIGRSFNVTKAGIHADGLLKNEEIYNVFNTEKLLNRPVELAVTDKSGQAGIALWVKQHFRKAKEHVSKNDPGVLKIYEWMMTQYDAGRTTAITDEELLDQTKLNLGHWLKENGYEL